MKTFLKIIRSRRFVGLTICIILAFWVWLMGKLSMRYTDRIELSVEYTHIPNNVFVAPTTLHTISVDIEGVGFSILKYKTLKKRRIELNINDLTNVGGNKYILPKSTFNYIDYNLFPDINLKNIYPDTLRIDLQEYAQKKVPVKLQMPIQTQLEYRLSKLIVMPDSVVVNALEHQLDTISGVYLNASAKTNVNTSFSEVFHLKNTSGIHYQTNEIRVNAEIIRVGEQEFSKEIQILNIPIDEKILLFPKKVKTIVSGNVHLLQSLKETDIVISADYLQRKDGKLPLKIHKKPEGLKVKLTSETTEYLIKK